MGWENSITVQTGEFVDTPHGRGEVIKVSENGYVIVEVNGQKFEVQNSDVKKEGQKYELKLEKGERVQKRSTGGQGTITEVTQRTVYIKWDANGKIGKVEKRKVSQELQPAQARPEGQPQPDQKKDENAPKTEKQKEDDTKARDTADDLYGLLRLKEKLENKIERDVDSELRELRDAARANQKLEIKVGDKTTELKGLKHKQLQQLITYAALRLSPLLVGMAGTGKTHAAEQVAEALGLAFYSMSVGAQTSKSDIIGYMDATGEYVRTHFRDAYENGGVFLMDEIDAGNANVLIQVNAALSNGLCAFPDAMVKKHQDFVFIASANTYGNGANRQYVGRNQLDAATLDRFAIIDWYIDDHLEESLAIGLYGPAWYAAVRAARDYVAEKNIRALISPRATQKGSRLLDTGQPLEEVINATLLGSVPEDKRPDVTQVAKSVYENFAKDVPIQPVKQTNKFVSEGVVQALVGGY